MIKWKVVGENYPISEKPQRWESPLLNRRADARRHIFGIYAKTETSRHFFWTFGPVGPDYEMLKIEIESECRLWIERVDTNEEEDQNA